jgi:lipid A disaccharide synthetase
MLEGLQCWTKMRRFQIDGFLGEVLKVHRTPLKQENLIQMMLTTKPAILNTFGRALQFDVKRVFYFC